MNRRGFVWFGVATVLLALAIFRGALWGERLLAPLDTAPALLSKYRWMDPGTTGVPANHYTIDQLTYDLPLQRTIHEACRRGEVPWWDPYTFGGRPLLADAHINGTDPFRLLCYALLPFELAYNWTLVLHWAVAGLGMFCLLRHWRIPDGTSVGLALAFACAGYHAVMFGHPWNTGAFLFYPWLWLAWDAGSTGRPGWAWPVGVLAMAGVFYAGNIQSHAYVVIFGAVVLVAEGGRSAAAWRRMLPRIALTGILGALLAAPVLAGQLEFYRLSVRPVPVPLNPVSWLSGLASLATVHPWALGTFRTLDLSKFVGQYALGFVVYLGSAAGALAVLGWVRGAAQAPRPAVRRVAAGLVLAYLVILSTPLQAALYTRSAGLAVLGLTVLAALGLEHLRASAASLRRWGWTLTGLATGLTLALNLIAFVVYPALLPRVREAVLGRAGSQSTMDAAPALREFQVRNLPNEISARNPETLLATVGLLMVAGLCFRPQWRRRPGVWPALLALNLAPVAMFYARFIPNQPIAAWHRLEAGGPEQQRVASALGSTPLRLLDAAPSIYDQVFPNCLGHLAGVRVLHGYSALIPPCLFNRPADVQAAFPDLLGDAVYRNPARGLAAGEFVPPRGGAPRNFQWLGAGSRGWRVEFVGLNRCRVTLDAGASGSLVWTDTAFPGWSARLDGVPVPLRSRDPCFSEVDIPTRAGPAMLELEYRPRWLPLGQALALAGMVGLTGLTAVARRRGMPAVDGKLGTVLTDSRVAREG